MVTPTPDKCWTCGATIKPDGPRVLLAEKAIPTCIPGICRCRQCYMNGTMSQPEFSKFTNRILREAGKRFDRMYKQFRDGKIWQEVEVKHTAEDGTIALQPVGRTFHRV
jgi:hypothetical protein